jgi:hypothetical protein
LTEGCPQFASHRRNFTPYTSAVTLFGCGCGGASSHVLFSGGSDSASPVAPVSYVAPRTGRPCARRCLTLLPLSCTINSVLPCL